MVKRGFAPDMTMLHMRKTFGINCLDMTQTMIFSFRKGGVRTAAQETLCNMVQVVCWKHYVGRSVVLAGGLMLMPGTYGRLIRWHIS